MAVRHRPLIERGAAAGILILAVVLAWVIADRPDDPPPPHVSEKAPPPPEPPPQADAPSPAAAAVALAVELVEIAEPPPKVAAMAAPVPVPQVNAPAVRVAAPPLEPPPPPPPPPQATPEPPPDAPPAPAPVKEIVPLRPTLSAPAPDVVPAALHPQPAPAQAREVVPLRPTPPQPKPEPEVIRVQRPSPPPKPAPAKQPPPLNPAVNVAAVMGEGRAFLKILEQGAGPGIEIRWPSEPSQRERLYGALVQCLGMRTGLLDGNGRLYLADGPKGQPSALDGERYSGFVRRPEGAIAREEEREIGRVRSYHQVRASASAARIFPRRVDAYLIGGLRQLVGVNYLKMKSIRATYRLANGRPVVESIVADGRRIPGVIDLSDVASSCS